MAGLRWWRRTVVFVGSRYWYLLHVKIHIFSCIWGSWNTFWIYLGFAGILNISKQDILLSVHVKVHIQPLYIVSCNTSTGVANVVVAALADFLEKDEDVVDICFFVAYARFVTIDAFLKNFHWALNALNKRLLPFVHSWTKDCFLSSKNEIEGSP